METENTLILVVLVAIFAALVLNVWWTRAVLTAARHAVRRREVLPMSTGVLVLPTQSAEITARPQKGWLRPERLFISDAGTAKGAADWIVNDIKIANRSQFAQSGDIPGDMFASKAIDSFVNFGKADKGTDIKLVVTYIGGNKEGCALYASFVGEGQPVSELMSMEN